MEKIMTVDELDKIKRAEEIQRYTENRCESLEKENAELKELIAELEADNLEKQDLISDYVMENATLKKQIEKMKNKLNCAKYHYCFCKNKNCKDCKDWKMND